jgi:hypothetical protein
MKNVSPTIRNVVGNRGQNKARGELAVPSHSM